MYYTYLLRCGDGSLYAGITTDPQRRMAEHRAGGKKGARYTRARQPLTLAALWESADRQSATRLEYRLKRTSHKAKEALLRDPADLAAVHPSLEGYRFVPQGDETK